jgi:hypothetical protein
MSLISSADSNIPSPLFYICLLHDRVPYSTVIAGTICSSWVTALFSGYIDKIFAIQPHEKGMPQCIRLSV